MIWFVLYTVILLFVYRDAANIQCMSALRQWFETMIPALFPMMLMSSVLVDTGFARKIGFLFSKTIFRPLPISPNACYCLLTGFLCGFPMGAKTVSDMYGKGHMSRLEALWLLSFVNCIGPLYTIHVTHTLFPDIALWKLIAGLYLLPLLYGMLVLVLQTKLKKQTFKQISSETTFSNLSIIDALYESVHKSGKSILILGGFMVLFQTFFLPLGKLLESISITSFNLYPLVEITGGLFLQPSNTSLPLILFWNTWGGACCMMQTYSFIKPVGLSMKTYVFHKTVLALISYLFGFILHQI